MVHYRIKTGTKVKVFKAKGVNRMDKRKNREARAVALVTMFMHSFESSLQLNIVYETLQVLKRAIMC